MSTSNEVPVLPLLSKVDRFKVQSLKDSLMLHIPKIIESQGFTKNVHDIKSCINCIDRSYLPKKIIVGRIKSARKLHCSLKLYLMKLGLIQFTPNYRNLFCDYDFLDNEVKTCLTSGVKVIKDILEVKLTADEEKEHFSTYYKPRPPRLMNDEEASRIGFRGRAKIQKKYNSLAKGSKYVDNKVGVLIKLKKKYKDEDELWEDLYKIYSNWHLSKINSTDTHIKLHESYMSRLGPGITNIHRQNHALSRYFLTKELLKSYVNKEKTCPKRFIRIVTTIRCIKDRKILKNNTYVDKLVEITKVISPKRDSLVFPRIDQISKINLNMKFYNWMSKIVDDLIRKNYITIYDIKNGKRSYKKSYKYGDNPLVVKNKDFSTELSYMPKFKRRTGKFYKTLKSNIIKYAINNYFDTQDIINYSQSIKNLKNRLKFYFSTDIFLEDLSTFINSNSLKNVSAEQVKVIRQNSNELLKALCKDSNILSYLAKEDMFNLKNADAERYDKKALWLMSECPGLNKRAAVMLLSKGDFLTEVEIGTYQVFENDKLKTVRDFVKKPLESCVRVYRKECAKELSLISKRRNMIPREKYKFALLRKVFSLGRETGFGNISDREKIQIVIDILSRYHF